MSKDNVTQLFDHEAEDALGMTDPDPDHQACGVDEPPRMTSVAPGALAAYVMWQHRHAMEHHGGRDLEEMDAEFISDLTSIFRLDLSDDTVRATIIRVFVGVLTVAMDTAESKDDVDVIIGKVLQTLGITAAGIEMGEYDVYIREEGEGD